MSKKDKWDLAYKNADFSNAPIASVLKENTYLLPQEGKAKALDLACGRAGNAQLLAKLGFCVDAIDISPVVLNGLRSFAKKQKLDIQCILHDVEKEGLIKKEYDVIVVSYFLNRTVFPQIVSSLKNNGLLLYQTWSKESVDDSGPSNPDFRLSSGELLKLCSSLQVLYYRENGREGDISNGIRNESMIIAKKVV